MRAFVFVRVCAIFNMLKSILLNSIDKRILLALECKQWNICLQSAFCVCFFYLFDSFFSSCVQKSVSKKKIQQKKAGQPNNYFSNDQIRKKSIRILFQFTMDDKHLASFLGFFSSMNYFFDFWHAASAYFQSSTHLLLCQM